MRPLLWGALALGCGGPPALPPLVCPERSELQVVEPVLGGRGEACVRKNGTRNGPVREYRPDGRLWKEGEYFNNRKHGRWRTYHPSGALAESWTYHEGRQQGWLQAWDEQGQLSRQVWFEAGREADPPPDAAPPVER